MHKFVASRVLWRSGLCRRVTIKHPSYRLRFHPTAVSAAMFCNPAHYAEDEAILRKVLRPGDTFVDVGANVGTLSFFAASIVGESGRVHAFEAHPRVGQYLQENASINDFTNVTVHSGVAIGATQGTAFLGAGRSDDQNFISQTDGVSVPMQTLDSFMPPASIRLLKIDVEGFEYDVIAGAPQTLARTEFVYFESWEDHLVRYGRTTQDVIQFLRQAGFSLDVGSDHISRKCENLLARKDYCIR